MFRCHITPSSWMSRSRSPTPTHNLSSANLGDSPAITTSRPRSSDEHPPIASVDELRNPHVVSPSSPPSAPSERRVEESSSTRRSSYLVRPAESSADEPMAKRMRRESPVSRARLNSHSSSESDSQDGMADNEMDVGKARRQEPLPPTAPPKKKRTRTLTTPHQSAVLHALLAQSRFPTTAMREEVGRSIGLSARKVQIWFQNQRQKARRPRSQSDTPSNRPPQYGPYPTPVESTPLARGFEDRGEHTPYYSGQPSPESQSGPAEPPARLLGPGMPGAPSGYPPQSYRQVHPPPPVSAPATEPRFSVGYDLPRALSPHGYRSSPRMAALPSVRPSTSQPLSWRERDPSRTLPPLFSPRQPSSYAARRIYSSGAHPYSMGRAAYTPRRSLSPESMFAHHPPEPISRPSMNIPPPFTLQPHPQWDESSYLPRPDSSSWSRPGSRSTRGRSTSPVSFRREPIESTSEAPGPDAYYLPEPRLPRSPSLRSIPAASTPPSRSGRYDPIRATFVPYSTPSPAASPANAGGGEDDEGDDGPNDKHSRS